MMRFITCAVTAVVFLTAAGCAEQHPPAAETAHLALPAGTTETASESFAATSPDWIFPEGAWGLRKADSESVLAQTSVDQVYPLALWKAKRYGDLDLSVRFRPLSGQEDASGGLVFRARDAKNYYLVRANGLEDNFRFYAVIDGSRRQIASVRVDPPALRQWHTLRIVAVGSHIQADFDGHLLIDHTDATYTTGYVGLWTKADSVTEFDDVRVIGTPLAGP